MKKLFKRPYAWAAVFSVLLLSFTLFMVLDTFVIARVYTVVEEESAQPQDSGDSVGAAPEDGAPAASPSEEGGSGEAVVTDSTYSDGSVSITITEYRAYDTSIYVADVVLANPESLKTAFANDAYGKNVTQKTSAIAAANSAILAINGDFYGAQNRGYVIRNGVLYRDTSSGSSQEDLVIYADGSFEIAAEGSASASELLGGGAVQVLSFGPGLVENGTVTVTAGEEVDKAKQSNPRTAIGVIDDLHYVLLVSDGRTGASEGLSLYQLASFLQELGVSTAYNLDGGGSSTMYFNGSVVNNPTTDGRKITERSVSDIVYIAS